MHLCHSSGLRCGMLPLGGFVPCPKLYQWCVLCMCPVARAAAWLAEAARSCCALLQALHPMGRALVGGRLGDPVSWAVMTVRALKAVGPGLDVAPVLRRQPAHALGGWGVACFRLQLPKLGGAGVMSREAPHTCCLTLAPLWAALEFISGSELLSSARVCCAACLSTGKTTASPTTMLCEQLSAPHCTAQTNLHAFKACLPLNKLCAC